MQQKLEPVVINIISGFEPDEQDILFMEHTRLKIDIKRTLALYRKRVEEKKTPLHQILSGDFFLNSNLALI